MSEDWQALLDDLRARHSLVGASFGILRDGSIETCASGLLNSNTRVECTPDSVFQIGSITKVFTATLIMQLIEQRRLGLDDRVIQHLPDFALADPKAARSVTIRQLLNHTCGIDGDFFPADDPEGPSTLSYVRRMRLLPNLYAPGAGPMTYSNSGYGVLGRIVEVLTERVWTEAVMRSICRPLGMPAAFADPRESLRFRCAIGHSLDTTDSGHLTPVNEPYLPISMAPVGTALTMSAESLLRFAREHMAPDVLILSAASKQAMQKERVEVLPFSRYGLTHWGLGWSLGDAPGYQMAGHDGGTAGQLAYLRLFPQQQVAFTLLTNSPSDKMFRELESHLLRTVLATKVPEEPPLKSCEVDASRYIGDYCNVAANYQVTQDDGGLTLHFQSTIGGVREFHATLKPYRADTFEIRNSNCGYDGHKILFLREKDRQCAHFIRFGLRMGMREHSDT